MFSRFQTHRYRWLGMVFVAMSLLVASLNDTILNTALPSMARELGSSTSQMQWLADAYVLVFASLLLTMGALSDRYGRKRFLLAGVAAFALFSVLVGLGRSTEVLIMGRALQGVAAAIIFPATLSLITAMFPEPHERGRAIGIWSAMFGLGIGIGPLLGGWLVEQFHWSAAFFVNVPVAAVAILGGQVFLPQSRDEAGHRPDVPGVILSSAGLFSLVYALVDAGVAGWTAPQVLLGFAVFAVLLVVFLWWERRAPNAMLPLYLFKNMSFTGASIAQVFALFALIGVFFYVPQFLQGVLGYSPFEAAVRLLPQSVLAIVFSTTSVSIVRRLGLRTTVVGGMFIASLAMLLLSLVIQPHLSYWWLIGVLMLMCVGVDTSMPAATMSIMGAIPPSRAGIGSAMNEMTGQIGGALGIAALGTLMNGHYLRRIEVLQAQLTWQQQAGVANSIFSAHQVARGLPDDLGSRVVAVADTAFSGGLSMAMIAGAAVMFLVAVVTWRLLPAQIQPTMEPSPVLSQPRPVVRERARP